MTYEQVQALYNAVMNDLYILEDQFEYECLGVSQAIALMRKVDIVDARQLVESETLPL